MIDVRALGEDDWRTWRDLRIRAVSDAPDSFAVTLDEELAKSDERWAEMIATSAANPKAESLVAYVDGDPAGIGYVTVQEEVALVFAMWVDPEHRRRGVATALLDRMADLARAAGARAIELWVTEGEDPAEALYRSAGFVPTGAVEPLRQDSDRLVSAQRRRL